MYKIVFIDIDGTLLNNSKILSEGSKKAVKQLKENGIEVVLATGRPPYHFDTIADELGIESYVSFNGTYVMHKGKVIHSNAIKKETLEKLVELSAQNKHPLVFSNHIETVSNHQDHPEVIESFDYLKVGYSPDYRPNFWKEADLYQAMLYCKEHEEDYYRKAIPELSFVRWHQYALDIMPANLSKATGVKAVLDYLGIAQDEAVAFGDGLNDREMLDFVGMGVAMGNAHAELKPYANMITKTVDEDGLAYGLRKLELV